MQSTIDAVLRAADPAEALCRVWPAAFADRPAPESCVMVAAGKASVAMARAALERLGVKPVVGAVVALPNSRPPASFHAASTRLFEADHPLPTQRNLIAAQAVADAARIAGARRLPLIVLISGGASAHLTLPERGLTLSDIRGVTDALLRSGATINELNTVRKKIEQLKGGGLARCAGGAPVYAFILSDVLGDPIDIIASGPTAEDRSTISDALHVLESRCPANSCQNVIDHLRKREKSAQSTPAQEFPASVQNVVIASNQTAIDAACAHLERLGFQIAEVRGHVEGEARVLGSAFAAKVLEARQAAKRPLAIIWGGETTVTVRGNGFGGRNQEAGVAAATALQGHIGVSLAFLATDGVDGSAPPGVQPNAGCFITGDSLVAVNQAGADAQACLETNNSFAFVQAANAALRTGPTGTNVNDIWIGLGYSHN